MDEPGRGSHSLPHGCLQTTSMASPTADRDGRVIGCNLPIGNGPLLEQVPAMAQFAA